MVAALGGAGFYFGKPRAGQDFIGSNANQPLVGRSPTKSTSEVPVTIASRPWDGDGQGKYKYHPGGDLTKEPKDAPSALNVVVVPNVTLPAELHEKYNKWGKDGYP
jgi:hypothetical protein